MAIEKWEILNQKVVFEHPRLTLIEDEVRLPDGNETTYLRYKRRGDAATIVAVNVEGEILLQREYSHPPAEVLYQFPGGGVPIGEDPAVGANRELMEECSYKADLENIGEYYLDNRRSDAKMYVFVATNLQKADLPSDAEEFIENQWLTEAKIDQLIANGEFKHPYVLAAWALYKSWQHKTKKNTRH